jgi:hypothetical protein
MHFGRVQVIKPASASNFKESTKLVGHPDPDPKLNIPLIIGAVAVVLIFFNSN